MSYYNRLPEIGTSTAGIAATATLYVSPNGAGSDGKTWASAFTTIQDALDAASTDADECTQIVISPHTTFYDINTTGDPTWTGNYHLIGSHRIWAAIKNTHATATSVLKFTGKASIGDLAIFTDNTNNADGVIFTGSGWRVRRCGFNSTGTDAANTSVHIDGSAALTRGGIMEDVQCLGHVTHTKGININTSTVNEFHNVTLHTCLTGLHIEGATSDYNLFKDCDIGDCALAVDIDAGNEQHFDHITFHHNTNNVDDEVGDSVWANIHGEFDISVTPDDFTGIAVDTGDGVDTWTAALQTIYTDAGDGPFRVVGKALKAGSTEWYRIQLTADDGGTYFSDTMFEASKQIGSTAPSGTEHIFNKGTVIKGRSKSESAGVDGLDVWLQIQMI